MALHLHRAERTDLLADGLGALLADPQPDPFAQELVLVAARGVERWLSQRLSLVLGCGPGRADGVCAGIAFRNPQSLIAEITGTLDDDPWSPEALAWPLLAVIDASLDEPWCRTLASHLGHFATTDAEAELRRGRRYSVARRLAGLFASYARQRPGLLAAWLDGDLGELPGDLAWQPPLWRALVTTVGADPPHVRHDKTIARLRDGPADLPARLSLFGHTRLACTDVQLLDALAVHHDLHLWLPHPSDELWRALAGFQGADGLLPRRQDTSRRAAQHPLLETLGRDVRELQRALPAARATDEFLGATTKPDTLLGWLQADIAGNAPRPAGRSLSDADRSVQVHACHGPARQIDVLREVLLGLLEDDPTLQPRDIVVMCPDIDTYAPLIVAGFGLGEVAGDCHPAHRLRVRLADRALTQTNPLLSVAAELLTIAETRATASQLLNLAQAAPVRAKFGFADDDLDTITTWVRESNIRWGFDPTHRRRYGLDTVVHNTWRFGLDRILTGVAMSEDSQAWLDTALPLDDVGSNRVELAGRLAEFVERLHHVVGGLSGARPLVAWLDALATGIDLLTACNDGWQRAQVQREFADVLARAGSRAAPLLRLPDVRALLDAQLAGRPTRANFRTGTLTVCTMVPMRSVPHRVVCLVGLDDGVFPRLSHPDGDDVLAREPMTGERDIRSEDRQLLLDAIGAATQTLVITYTGADERTGQPRPPAVPLAELLDALDQTTSAPVRERILVTHPLQPFDRKNVTPGALLGAKPFTFDPAALAAAQAAAGKRCPPTAFISGRLPAPPAADVTLADLLDFFKDPVKGFFRALDYTLPWDVDTVEDSIPVQVDALAEWTVGERMLRDMLRGLHPDDAAHSEWRRGTLPPGRLGVRRAKEIRNRARSGGRRAGAPRRPRPGARRRRRPRRRAATERHGDTRVRRAHGVGDLLKAGAQACVAGVDRPGYAGRPRAWPRVVGAVHRPQQDQEPHRQKAFRAAAGPGGGIAGAGVAVRRRPARTTAAAAEDVLRVGPGTPRRPRPLPARPRMLADQQVPAGRRRRARPRASLGPARTLRGVARQAPRGRRGRRGRDPARGAGRPAMAAAVGRRRVGLMDRFELLGPLPREGTTTVLEASAGTGKTFALAGLVTRYLAETAATLDEMLLITFNRAASRELRERVRGQIVEAVGALQGDAPPSGELVEHLLRGSDAERAQKRSRLRDALANFDAATIATTHEFCGSVLKSLGVAGDNAADVELKESLTDLVTEIVDDRYLANFGRQETDPELTYAEALALALAVVDDPCAQLRPPDPEPGSKAAVRLRFAAEVLEELERRKGRLRAQGFNDLLIRLATALEAADSPARDRMRERWRIVLVDEFQDTDPMQWRVLERAFSRHSALILIGDPKQAIYGFRGGDIHTYLKAAGTADARYTLGVNWRSDRALVESLQTVLRDATLGHADIVVRGTDAHHAGHRLASAPRPAPFRLRVVKRHTLGYDGTAHVPIEALRRHIPDDLAADVAALLASGATFAGRPVVAADIAVIVEHHKDARACRNALAEAGIPAIYTGDTDVFASQAAKDWLCLLEAFDAPQRSGLVRAAACTMFFGETAESLAAEGDALTDRVAGTLREWADHARHRGVAAVFQAAQLAGMGRRVLSQRGGERDLTDLAHIAQLLHEAAHRERLGLPGLRDWLRRQAKAGAGPPEHNRRLDSDAAAVQIMTVFVAKGLQFPIVYLPFAFNRNVRSDDILLYHDDGTRCLYIGGKDGGAQRRTVEGLNRVEAAHDNLRLTYVALTRAQSQVVAWWAPTFDEVNGGLSRLLRGRRPGQSQVPDRCTLRVTDEQAWAVFAQWEAAGGPSVEESVIGARSSLEKPVPVPGFEVRHFHRRIDTTWRRTSYSDLVRGSEAVTVTSEPAAGGRADEVEIAVVAAPGSGADLTSPLAALPSGASFGSLVHAVLETADPAAPDLAAELEAQVRRHAPWWTVDVDHAQLAPELARALLPMHDTPLGPAAAALTLRQIGVRDRLRELDFEMPLAGGDLRGRSPDVSLADVGELLASHLPGDDPLSPYADRLGSAGLGDQPLRGYLAGSIDVVLRLPGQRYLVVDYKTNHLGDTAADYGFERLTEAMLHSDYPLQALLYVVVLHRFLRWRQRDYAPARHLGGVLYLFVRGMCGAATPVTAGHPAGVFTWNPPTALVVALSDLLDRGRLQS